MERFLLGAGRNGPTFNERSDICSHQTGSRRRAKSPISHTPPLEPNQEWRGGANTLGLQLKKFYSRAAQHFFSKEEQSAPGGRKTTAGAVFLSLRFCCCSTTETPPETSSSSDWLRFQGLHTSGSFSRCSCCCS